VADDAAAPEPDAGGPVELDDVIVAWAEILPNLPPATRAAVSEAQPLAVDDGVITFGVPRPRYDVALPRFRKEADNIRAALSEKLGRRMMFKPVPHDGFDADPARSSAAVAPGGDDSSASAARSSAPPLDEEPPEDDVDYQDLVDEAREAPAVDSVSLITQSLGAVVVEEVRRD
jgi:hypothetical protein